MSKKNRKYRRASPKASGYSEAGASLTRRSLKGFRPNSSSPGEDIDLNNFTLRQRSRMLYMAAPLASAAIKTNRTKVVGVGLTLSPMIDYEFLGMSQEAATRWQRQTLKEFNLWAGKKQNCDALGLNNFAGLQQLALKAWLMSGDVFALVKRYDPTPLNPYGLRLHLIEADRISTPDAYKMGPNVLPNVEGIIPKGQPGAGHKIHDGVEVDSDGMVQAYHICNGYPQQMLIDCLKWTRVTAYGAHTGQPNVLHIMESERPDSYRGVPYLANVIETLLQQRRYTESELTAALVQSFFTAWIKTVTNKSEIPMNEVGAGDINGIPSENPNEENMSTSESEYEMGPGTVLHLGENEEVQFGSPNIPTAGFEVFMKTITKMIGAALELPYDVLVKEFNSSYSASRGALLEAWEAFRMRRGWFVDSFCQPVYEMWLAEAVARGRVKAPGFFNDPAVRAAWCGARWIGPVQGQLDPKKEVEAGILMTAHGFKTHEQVTRELGGGDWNENMDQVLIEREKCGDAAVSDVLPSERDPKEDE
ncbi:lambda family phage portal protein [Fusobacterium naviforme]|nr:lambda family phage portal protein [Fusobacterium naviforme]STO27697.1 phage portal protein, lambda family [Fusobacterium naviforme]